MEAKLPNLFILWQEVRCFFGLCKGLGAYLPWRFTFDCNSFQPASISKNRTKYKILVYSGDLLHLDFWSPSFILKFTFGTNGTVSVAMWQLFGSQVTLFEIDILLIICPSSTGILRQYTFRNNNFIGGGEGELRHSWGLFLELQGVNKMNRQPKNIWFYLANILPPVLKGHACRFVLNWKSIWRINCQVSCTQWVIRMTAHLHCTWAIIHLK